MKPIFLLLLLALLPSGAVLSAAAEPEIPEAFRGKPLWSLEAGSAPAGQEGLRQLTGEISALMPEATARQAGTFAESRREGHSESGMTLRYELPADFPGGAFRMAALYTTGGHVTLLFTFRQTDAEGKLLAESKCKVRSTSWQERFWVSGEAVTLLPGRSFLEVTMSGRSSKVKKLTRILLAAEDTRQLTAEQAALRQRLASAGAGGTGGRLLLLEGEDAAAADALFRALVPHLSEGIGIQYLSGEKAEAMRELLELDSLPAAILCDSENRIANLAVSPAGAENFFTAPVLSPVPVSAPVAGTEPGGEMLVAGTWAGPAGLSLLGLDAEENLFPSEGDAVPVMYWDRRLNRNWRSARPGPDGRFLIETCENTYVWPRGSAYAFCCLVAKDETVLDLSVEQSGSETFLWLDGEKRSPAETRKISRGKRTVSDVTDQGNPVELEVEDRAHFASYRLKLRPGTHRLLLKFVMEHRKGERFDFSLNFGSDRKLLAATTDPEGNPALHRRLNRLAQFIDVSAPSNLPRAGEPLKITTRLSLPGPRSTGLRKSWPVLRKLDDIVVPERPFRAVVEQSVVGYDGRELRRFRQEATVPGEVTFDFGPAPERGYYAIRTELKTLSGERIGTLYPDGFSVIGGAAARGERRADLKMFSVHYWVTPENVEEMTDYLARIGIFHHIGSGIGYRPEVRSAFERKGLTLTADFIDPHGTAAREARFRLAKEWSVFTDRFKSINEIDIHKPPPDPAAWVERTREEYEAVKAANPQAEFTGGTYVRPGVGDWFTECVKLGLDRWVDRWDVHAYPQKPPRLGDRYLGNSSREDAAGIDLVYSRLGRKNPHPFLMGETGARCGHGTDARRWQADTVPKMLAWALSRPDYSGIAFLVPHWKMPDGWDIPVTHHPAEAAMYTAGVLIDGFRAEKAAGLPPHIEAARFGRTLMAWNTGRPETVALPCPAGVPLALVDVVGGVTLLPPAKNGSVAVELTASPVYLLPEAEYRRLTQ